MDVVEPDIAEGVEPIEGERVPIVGWCRTLYSYPRSGGPDEPHSPSAISALPRV